jgi:hypothetical protein
MIGPSGPCAPDATPYMPPRCTGPDRCVDVLFVVDNRETMLEEQVSLFMEVPRLTRALTTGDLDGDGGLDFPPVVDLHFAAITADLGSGGTFVDGCLSPDFGDDAILGRGRTGRLSDVCGLDIPPFLAFGPTLDRERFELDAACSVTMGIFGCPYAQPLDAALKALSASSDAPRFFRDTCGHANGENAGFLRSDSVLAVFVVSDHDDCSVRDPAFFSDAAIRSEDPGVICDVHAADLHDTRRYVDGLSALRSDPADLIFAPIVGLPPESVPPLGEAPDFAAILGHPDMQVRLDPRDPMRLAPSCAVAGRGVSFPPRRHVQLAAAIDARGVSVALSSVCGADVLVALNRIVDRL